MILKLMILSSLHVYELIVTTSSLSSFRKPKSTLETPACSSKELFSMHVVKQLLKNHYFYEKLLEVLAACA